MTTGPATIWTLDWVPDGPRGFVRDLRLRWACEEAGFPYRVRTVPFEGRETNHLDRQPFGQVPMLEDGGIRLSETGAGLIHLGGKSDTLMPTDEKGRAETIQWIFAGLNTLEMVTNPWIVMQWAKKDVPEIDGWLDNRLGQMETILAERDWLVGDRFTLADLVVADVLRVDLVRAHGDRPASEAYVTRVTDRPAFRKAHADQMAHFEKADETRSEKDNG
ncbi:glutathione S-transferase family protein [uncultured Jannaschia sp.]|uniref:glutathione S-transferase family protein n=1 Tax=uncultured Jannaschia sp. TaxID=293347 RepID=UPI0026328B63|nr:glutathione S-transferase family protein [uncultured Jannaschia sp.]